MPQSPTAFKDAFKSGYHGTVGFGWKLMPSFQAVAKAELHSFGLDFAETGLAPRIRISPAALTAFSCLALTAAFLWAFQPHRLNRLYSRSGLAKVDQTDFSGDPLATSMNSAIPDAQSKMYWNIGAGIELKGTPLFGLFAQVRYVSIATDGESQNFIPITLGLKFF